ncbi:MAG TPA: N-acetylmuramoyl-L-alanine amidase [Verrucomicrobiae bacterium]|nr:N-acetylmuramoyl-L-alanine amidase [Verrucomicrobiae bacterium]
MFKFLRLSVGATVWVFGIFAGLPLLNAATFDGQNYVPLGDFARANGFRIYSETTRENVLSKSNLRLVFDVNSAQAQIGGVNVRLSYPVAADHGELLVSQLDVETALHPLIYAPKSTGRRITTICLDPGHGGRDTGNRVVGFLTHNEKTYTLALGLELKRQLTLAGFHVVMTRTKDVFVELTDRPALANRDGADLFVSLHFNATQVDKNTVSGPETYCITPVGAESSNSHGENGEFGSAVGTIPTVANRCEDRSLLLAYEMEKSLVQNLRANDRGVRRARFAVLRDASMPAILIEGGYMTNPWEGRKIYSADYRRQMAAAIVKGILAYQKLTAPVPHRAG